jgi:molybdopterin synthase catalytic subunit
VEPTPTTVWISLSHSALSLEEIYAWSARPECGAVVTFCGTVRRTSGTRQNVEALEYETSIALAEEAITKIVTTARTRWPMIEAVAIHHRIGRVELGEIAVIVAVSCPHRGEAFDAAQFCIDTLKESVPMWKRELWDEGAAWSEDTHDIVEVPKQ